jgi:nucleosome-remodeling factor subunit BPTF
VIQWTVIFQFFLCIHFSEKYTPQRSGLRERKRAESPKQTEPSVTEVWVPEEELEIWEIKQFGEK